MTQEIKDKLKQAAETAWEQDQKTNPSPVNPHAYVYGYKAGAKTILENPGEWGLMPILDSMDHIEESDQNWSDVVNDLESQLAKYREALAISNPWPITDILSKLIEASETLLHECGYDGHKPGQMPYEDINICVDEAKKAITRIKQALKQEVNND